MHGTPGEHNYLFAGISREDVNNKQLKPVRHILEAAGIRFPIHTRAGDLIRFDERAGSMKVGAVQVYTATEANFEEMVNGHNIAQYWVDEVGLFDNAKHRVEQLDLAVRKGVARGVFSTTPKEKNFAVYQWLQQQANTVWVTSNSYENLSNLSGYLPTLLQSEGTRLSDAEVWGEVLSTGGSLFKTSMFVSHALQLSAFDEIVISVDPATSDKETADDTGIVVLGKYSETIELPGGVKKVQEKFHVIEDSTDRFTPKQACIRIGELYETYKPFGVSFAVVEINNGGGWIVSLLKEVTKGLVPVKEVTATKDKFARASIVANQYDLEKVTHSHHLSELENEMLRLTRDSVKKNSPNRVDALGWALHYFLNLEEKPIERFALSASWGSAPGCFF